MTTNHPFFTIGHSTRSMDEFAALLQVGRVQRLVDVRTVRRSRRNPQYNADSLGEALAPFGIVYDCIPELGGLRKQVREIPPERNGFWENRSFHNYADYALTEPFKEGLETLVAMARRERCCIMCAEAVWWRCHRRIISDHLIGRQEDVFHLLGADRMERAALTRGAVVEDDGVVVYPVTGGSPLS